MSLRKLQTFFQNERLRSFVFWFTLLIACDQIIKCFVFRLVDHSLYAHVGQVNVVGVQLFRNYNFAFSIPIAQPYIFLVYGIVLAVIVRYVVKTFNEFDYTSLLAWTLILAGAFSNIVERILTGYVKDFVYVLGGGIFNFADFFILSGILLLLFVELRNKKL